MSTRELAEGVRGAHRQSDADVASLARFCIENHRRIVGLLALYTGDLWVAEELAQEAFVRACRDWSKVCRMGSPEAWLNSVAVNLANSRWRRRVAEHRANVRHGVDRHSAPEDTATTLSVRAAVASLPRRQRTAVVLRYYARMTVDETAEAMNCAPGTVKSLTNRALGALRREGLVEMKESRSDY